MQFPILSVLIFTPLAAALILLLLPEEKKTLIKGVALAAGIVVLALSVWLYASYDIAAGGYQFKERVDWLPALGISYFVGVDGISLPLVFLSGLVIVSGVLVSWNVHDRPREFFSFLMFLGASVVGVFCSLDLFMLFFFFELAVFPKYLMIVTWGSPKTREYGGMKLTLYLFIGSMLALIGALAIYFGSGLAHLRYAGARKRRFRHGLPALMVPVRISRLCHSGRHLPVPLLGAGWPRGGSHCHLHAAGGC